MDILTLLAVGCTAVFVLVGCLWFSGCFVPISFRQIETDPIYVVYQSCTGPFRNTYKVLKQVEALIKTHDVASDHGFGIFFDNPRTTAESDLKWLAGYVVPLAAARKIETAKVPGLECGMIEGGTKYGIMDLPMRSILSLLT
ncbi:hypothetical protein KIPB_001582 [Kipferlia bialata]|uniref:GyrI-like small molecule binding domain-containing protein n=1 Tax=Kipferlia bialata TaxID=797122 RepID=A0A391NJK9_9EUKA|nr:hypothetical protein KIPB_001582 [Kipferlia bialata]|eukprot:g1582.t1